MIQLSIVIVNYNVEYFLQQCLSSVYAALKGIDAEVFVVDNNSIDGSVAMVKEKFPEAILIENKENTGFSRANNQAIRKSTGKYVLLLNPDTLVEEDTFSKVLTFMDAHPDAGGLGVKMLDGKGQFLPESKRGLPTPEVAFYKIFGLSALFPRSRKFGRYHLGFLSDDETHEVPILSGAFMLLRKEVLDKIGLLDEQFFMYGEDIDLSWRIVKAGYKNYYFPGTRIIHYKGESTKKGSVNYVFVFYRAMVIFAEKHFTEKRAQLFGFFINLAIWFRASLAILYRFLKKLIVPLLDVILILAGLWFVVHSYEDFADKTFEALATKIALPAYTAIWMISLLLNGAYEKPFKPLRWLGGVLLGSALILIGYSLLPEAYRFSRAVILLGTASTLALTFTLRLILRLGKIGGYRAVDNSQRKFAMVGSASECDRVLSLLQQAHADIGQVWRVSPNDDEKPKGFTGNINQLREIANIYKPNEIIFCARDLSSQQIIDLMTDLEDSGADFKIAPPESLYIIGSGSIERGGELFIMEINPVSKPSNRRKKRILDIYVALVLLISYPFNMWWVHYKGRYLGNIFQVLRGKKTWVGYALPGKISGFSLPKLSPGVLTPMAILSSENHSVETARKLNTVYARDYRRRNDLNIIIRAFRKLGDPA